MYVYVIVNERTGNVGRYAALCRMHTKKSEKPSDKRGSTGVFMIMVSVVNFLKNSRYRGMSTAHAPVHKKGLSLSEPYPEYTYVDTSCM